MSHTAKWEDHEDTKVALDRLLQVLRDGNPKAPIVEAIDTLIQARIAEFMEIAADRAALKYNGEKK